VAAPTKTTSKQQLSNGNLMIVMILITLLVVGVAGLLAKSLITTIARDTTVVQKKLAADDQLAKNIKAAPSLIADYNRLGDKNQAGTRARTLESALPNDPDFPSLLVTMDVSPSGASAAAASNSTAAPEPQPYAFGISLTGSYPNINKALASLELSARPMRITEANFAGSGNSLNATIAIETYYQDKGKLPFGTETVK
jgi:Tfp pilus assembly protein PilO